MLITQTHRSLVAGFSTLALALGNPAAAEGERLFSIPPGNAIDTLNTWTDQSGIQILFDFPTAQPWRTHGVVGTLRPLDALSIMLRDTPLTYEIGNPRTVYVIPGSQYCQPWLKPAYAPLPPCVQMPESMQGARL